MHLSRLRLTDFRSYESLDLDLSSGTTLLIGTNGAGKTNIVESIHYLGTMSSHRVAAAAPLIRKGTDRAIVQGAVTKAGRSLVIEATIASGESNTIRVNGSVVRPRDAIGILKTVVFSPEDIDLVRGEPAGRRRFLDTLGVSLSPVLTGDLGDYERVVRQKGALLKSLRGRESRGASLEVWNEKLASLGARILSSRLETLDALAPHVADAYSEVAQGDKALTLDYGSAADVVPAFRSGGEDEIRTVLLEAMASEANRERERGMCLVGPHRDDLVLSIGSLPARGYASHGEAWSAALSLRLGTYDLLTAAGGPDAGADGEPLLLLDDVFAELDGTRRRALANRAHRARQVMVTAAVRDDVPSVLGGAVLEVAEGKAVPGA